MTDQFVDLLEAVQRSQVPHLEARAAELERHAIAVTRMWDALSRCEDEFPPGDPEVAVCAELQERLDTAIDGLMKLADREMWDRRQAWLRESSEIVLRESEQHAPPDRCVYRYGGRAGQCLYNAVPGTLNCRKHSDRGASDAAPNQSATGDPDASRQR